MKISVLVLYTNDTMSGLQQCCGGRGCCYLLQRSCSGGLLRRGLLVPVFVFPATPSPRASDFVLWLASTSAFQQATCCWQFCFLESVLAKICSKSVIQFLTDTYEVTIEVTFRELWDGLSFVYNNIRRLAMPFFDQHLLENRVVANLSCD